MCLFMQTQFQLDGYIHGCVNKTHTLAIYKPTLAGINIRHTSQPKVGIKFAYLLKNVSYLCMHGAAYGVGSQLNSFLPYIYLYIY